MKGIKRASIIFTLILVSIFLVSCGGGETKTTPTGEEIGDVKKGGVFGDVITVLSEEDVAPPEPTFKKDEMTKKEWKLFIQARNRLYVPLESYEYYYEDEYTDDPEGDTDVDSLGDILKKEQEQYQTLRYSLKESFKESTSDTGKDDGTIGDDLGKVDEKLNTFFSDLTELMEVTPDAKREEVLEIVCLRFNNTLLRLGILPETFSAK
jgi:hypothetical protein